MTRMHDLYWFVRPQLPKKSATEERYYLLSRSNPEEVLEIHDWKSFLTRTSLVASLRFNPDNTLRLTFPWYVSPKTKKLFNTIIADWKPQIK